MKFILLLVLTAMMIPFKKEGLFVIQKDKWTKEVKKKYLNPTIFVLPVVFWILVGLIEYFGLVDNNVSSLLTGYAFIAGIFISISLFFQGSTLHWEKKTKIGVVILLDISFVYFLILNGMFSAGAQYAAVDKTNDNISEKFDENDTPFIVPPKTAEAKMNKVFNGLNNVSYYELGSLTPQKIDGQLEYVAPIEISGFWNQVNGSRMSPGYITMSGTDPDADAVLHDGYNMKYVPSKMFGDNLERHVRSAEPNAIFKGEPILEVDDRGKPFYVMTYGEFVSGRSGFKAEGVVVTDPQSGDVKTYPTNEIPSFIEGGINYDVAAYENDVFGKYVHGFFNFSKTDVKEPTDWGTEEGVTPIFGKDGKMYYFTDFTSTKSSVDSVLGYSLIDARTGKLNYYSGKKELAGVMDASYALKVVNNTFKSAQSSNFWSGTMPVLYNVYGTATWIVPIVDNGGLVRSYALVDGANGKVFATDPIEKEAFKKYKNALTMGDGMVNSISSAKAKNQKVSGIVARTYKEVSSDNSTTVYVLLKGHKEIYMISATDFPYSLFTETGDAVAMTYSNTGDQMVSVSDYVDSSVNQ